MLAKPVISSEGTRWLIFNVVHCFHNSEICVHTASISWAEGRPGNFQRSLSTNIANLTRRIACNIPSPTNIDPTEIRTTTCYAAAWNSLLKYDWHIKPGYKKKKKEFKLFFISLEGASAEAPCRGCPGRAGCPPRSGGCRHGAPATTEWPQLKTDPRGGDHISHLRTLKQKKNGETTPSEKVARLSSCK